jgi:imidazolonepropionase-like amidohydrolase
LHDLADSTPYATSVKTWRYEKFLSPPGNQALECAKNAMMELRQGVTTVRELGGPNVPDQINPPFTNVDLRDAIDAGFPGPRIVACRLMVTMTGGHGYPAYEIREADGPDEVRKAVREQIKGGADCIKIMSSAGMADYPREHPGINEYTVEELRVAAEETHRRERKITTHAMSDVAVKNAIEAGIDTIEHGFLMEPDTVTIMLENDISFVPTTSVCRGVATSGRSGLGDVMKNAFPRYQEAVLRAVSEGVVVGVGTDSRYMMIEEMESLAQMGMSPMDVITSATSAAAAVCGLQRLGVVAKGHIADLVLLGDDPTRNIRKAFEDVRFVMRSGKVMASSMQQLSAELKIS